MNVLASSKVKGAKGKKRKAETGKRAPVKKKQKQVEAIEIDDDVDDDELEEEGFYFAEEEGDGDEAGDVDAEEALLASGMMEEDGFEVWR